MKTQAALLVQLGKPLELAEIDIPHLKPGQALVEIAYTGICHTQLSEVRGHRGDDPFLPHCLGHEASGIVREIGPEVTRVRVGDAVVLSWIKGPGANVAGSIYRWGSRNVNAGAVTTFQRHAVVSENRLTPVPAGLSLKDAVLLGCALPTGMGAVVNTAAASAGESVAVFGAGGIGLCAIVGAVSNGCTPVFAVDPSPVKRELATKIGATHTIDPAAADPVAEIKNAVASGVDVAIEATGIPSVMVQALDSVRPRGGRAVIIGNARKGQLLTLDPRAFNDGKRLLGCWGGDAELERDVPRFAEAISSGRADVAVLLSPPYPLDRINEALDDLESGRIARPLIDLALG